MCHGEAANQPSTSTTKSVAPPARYSEMLPSAPTGTMVMFAVVVNIAKTWFKVCMWQGMAAVSMKTLKAIP